MIDGKTHAHIQCLDLFCTGRTLKSSSKDSNYHRFLFLILFTIEKFGFYICLFIITILYLSSQFKGILILRCTIIALWNYLENNLTFKNPMTHLWSFYNKLVCHNTQKITGLDIWWANFHPIQNFINGASSGDQTHYPCNEMWD